MDSPRSRCLGFALILVLALPGVAWGTPVAKTREEHALLGRVFLEPKQSVDYVQFETEFEPAMELLEDLYPRYLKFTTVADELNDKNAVSVGEDGAPRWNVEEDTGDGLPLHMAIVTDGKVPDKNKGYVFLTNAHAAEPCGREGGLRFIEDLLIWRTNDPDHKLDDGSGLTGKTHELTVKQLLERTKIYFVNVAPDGWSAGDTPGFYSQSNGGGFNSNRLVYNDGWVFPDHKILSEYGYSALTQPEGAAVAKYLLKVRREELNGRPFAAAADMHGPLPVGAVLLHDQGNDVVKLQRMHDFAERIEQKMEAVLGAYLTEQGVAAYEEVMTQAGEVRDEVLRAYTQHVGPVTEKALWITLQWAEYAAVWEHLDYTVTTTWGGWAASDSGLDADTISYEVDCLSYATYNGPIQQLFVDNIRAILETTTVHAAVVAGGVQRKERLSGTVGFYEPGVRVTDRDGNPVPPPKLPRNPIWGRVEQAPYDVSNTDYFRDLRAVVSTPIREVTPAQLSGALNDLDTFAITDTDAPIDPVKEFVKAGGKLVLTDSALKMLPDIVGVPNDAIRLGHAYVGYADLDREHPFTEGLYERARQMFDPVGLGYPLLMERDQYWPCDTITGECEKSPTKNSSPIWTVDRAAWEKAGGEVVGTADPPEDRHGGAEGFQTNKVEIGIVKLGKGTIYIFGGLLPQPTEEFDHWFGLNAYTVTLPGHALLMRALGLEAPTESQELAAEPAKEWVN